MFVTSSRPFAYRSLLHCVSVTHGPPTNTAAAPGEKGWMQPSALDIPALLPSRPHGRKPD